MLKFNIDTKPMNNGFFFYIYKNIKIFNNITYFVFDFYDRVLKQIINSFY